MEQKNEVSPPCQATTRPRGFRRYRFLCVLASATPFSATDTIFEGSTRRGHSSTVGSRDFYPNSPFRQNEMRERPKGLAYRAPGLRELFLITWNAFQACVRPCVEARAGHPIEHAGPNTTGFDTIYSFQFLMDKEVGKSILFEMDKDTLTGKQNFIDTFFLFRDCFWGIWDNFLVTQIQGILYIIGEGTRPFGHPLPWAIPFF